MKKYPEEKHPDIQDIIGHSPFTDNSIQRIEQAIDFHKNNNYPGKMPNISFDGVNGALNKALDKKLGFRLKKSELDIVHREVKSSKIKRGIKR